MHRGVPADLSARGGGIFSPFCLRPGRRPAAPHSRRSGAFTLLKIRSTPWDASVVAEDIGAELEAMALLKDQGALTEAELDTWCFEHFSSLPGTHLSLQKSR